MIAQGFGFTRDFLKERNNSAYCRLKKITCGFKEQARARHPGEKCGLARVDPDPGCALDLIPVRLAKTPKTVQSARRHRYYTTVVP